MKKTKLFSHRQAAVLIALLSGLSAAAENPADPARFERPSMGSVGTVNYTHPMGRYVYGEVASDRTSAPAFAIGAADRQDYEFFSYQEEEALWLVMQDQLEETAAALKRGSPKFGARKASTSPLLWPRVVVKDALVCVPTLEKSDAADWLNHLICTAEIAK